MKRLAVAFLCLALLAAPLGAGTQPPRKIFRIGGLSVAPPSALASASVPYARNLAAFRESLRDLGYVEGRNPRHRMAVGRGAVRPPPPWGREVDDSHGRAGEVGTVSRPPVARGSYVTGNVVAVDGAVGA